MLCFGSERLLTPDCVARIRILTPYYFNAQTRLFVEMITGEIKSKT